MLIVNAEHSYLSFWVIDRNGNTIKSIDFKLNPSSDYQDLFFNFINIINFLDCRKTLMQAVLISKKNIILDNLVKFSREYLKISPVTLSEKQDFKKYSNLSFTIHPIISMSVKYIIENMKNKNFIYVYFGKLSISISLIINSKIEDINYFFNPIASSQFINSEFHLSDEISIQKNNSSNEEEAFNIGSFWSIYGSVDRIVENFIFRSNIKDIDVTAFAFNNNQHLKYCQSIKKFDENLINKAIIEYLI